MDWSLVLTIPLSLAVLGLFLASMKQYGDRRDSSGKVVREAIPPSLMPAWFRLMLAVVVVAAAAGALLGAFGWISHEYSRWALIPYLVVMGARTVDQYLARRAQNRAP